MSLLLVRVLILVALLIGLAAYTVHRRRRRLDWVPQQAVLPLRLLPYRVAAPLHLVGFSSRLCSECHEVPAVALQAAPEVPLVTLDVQDHPDLVRRLGIRTTPTLLLVDEKGRIRWAHVGVPDPGELWLYVREAWDSSAWVRRVEAQRKAHQPQS